MSTIVIMPGGFHPFHAGHADLYQQAKKAFPGADIYVAATNDQSERPFPFALKEKLAKLAGVESGHFVQVKSPFQAKEITQHYNPEQADQRSSQRCGQCRRQHIQRDWHQHHSSIANQDTGQCCGQHWHQ